MASFASRRLVPVCVTSSWLSLSLDRKEWLLRGGDVPPAARSARRCTSCEVALEVNQTGKDRWGLWRANPLRRKQEQDRINAYSKQEQEQKAAARAAMDEMVRQRIEYETENAHLKQKLEDYEVENARVNVDNTGLRKDRERLEQENKKLRSLKRLGESRLQKALREGKSRWGKIAWSIMSTCPFIDKEDAAVFAKNIDSFEDFDHPDNLRAEVVYSALIIHWGSDWQTEYNSARRLTKEQQEALLTAVSQQITEQKALFPVRAQIKAACERHLCGVLRIGGEETTPAGLHRYLSAAKDKEDVAAKMQKDLCGRFEKVFRELDNNHMDVEAILLDSWKPLELMQATWLHAFLQSCARPEPLRAEWKIPEEEVTQGSLTLYDVWLNFRGAISQSPTS